MIRPSLTLVLDLDETLATEETIQEIKRSYSHIGTPVIRTHKSEGEDEPYNKAQALLKLGTKQYLKHSDEGADELWDEVMEQWIGNAFHRIGNNMKVFNDRQREINLPQVFFESFDLVLQGGALTIAVHPSPEGLMDPALKNAITQARDLYNDSLLGEEAITLINLPAQTSYDEQKDQAWAEWVELHPEVLTAKEDEADSEGVKAEDCEAAQPKTREELLQEDIIAKSYENTAVSPSDSDALPAPEKLITAKEEEEDEEQFTFVVDYRLWAVTYESGKEALFDSEVGTFTPCQEA